MASAKRCELPSVDYCESPVITACEVTMVAIEAQDNGRLPRFNIDPAYNGGPLTVARYNFPIIVDLEGLEVDQQSVAANLHHDSTKIVGHVDSVQNDGMKLSLSGPISGAGASADEFIESQQKQFPWKASIEARPTQKPDMVPAGETVFVNGRSFPGPVLVARKSVLYGVSFVPRGADDGTIVSVAAEAVA